MPSAQDYALLALAYQQGWLSAADLSAVARAREDRGDAPLAHLLLRRGLLPAGVVATLLRELAQGSFACARCAERLPYFGLAGLRRLVCPLCGGRLAYRPNPLGATLGIARGGALDPDEAWLDTTWDSSLLERHALAGGPGEDTVTVAGPGSSGPSRVAELVAEAPPRRLGPYVLVRELGRGGNGVVFVARRDGGDRDVALKVLHGPFGDPESLARFRQEVKVARRLRHPGIVPVLDVGSAAGRHYYAMELCRGPTLREALAGGPLPVDAAARTVRAVAEAVAVVHAQGIVHRDLKPANVLLDVGGTRPRITDFGLARDPARSQALTRSGDILGTPCYMAPEQFAGDRVDLRTDVYALGVILYECLTGRRPHDASTIALLAERVVNAPPPPPSSVRPVPPALDAVCRRALAREPADRYGSAGELVDAIDAVVPRP